MSQENRLQKVRRQALLPRNFPRTWFPLSKTSVRKSHARIGYIRYIRIRYTYISALCARCPTSEMLVIFNFRKTSYELIIFPFTFFSKFLFDVTCYFTTIKFIFYILDHIINRLHVKLFLVQRKLIKKNKIIY